MTRYALNSALAGLLLAVLPAPAAFAEGPYVDGKPHGQWNLRFADGSTKVREFRHGERIE